MERAELIKLVERIQNADGTEKELDALMEILKQNVSHPEVSDLIFYSDPELSPEEVVERALSYKPIQL